MTKYRVKRNHFAEWLAKDGKPTADPTAAAGFDSHTEAAIFMLRSLADCVGWHVEPCADIAPEQARGCATKVVP